MSHILPCGDLPCGRCRPDHAQPAEDVIHSAAVSCQLPDCPVHPKGLAGMVAGPGSYVGVSGSQWPPPVDVRALEARVAKLEKAQMIWRVPPDLLRQLRAIVHHIETRPATGYSAVTLHTDEDGARALLAILEER